MEQPAVWEMVLAGALVALVLFWWRPGIRAAFEQSRNAQNKDWRGVIVPLLLVAAFVLLMLALI